MILLWSTVGASLIVALVAWRQARRTAKRLAQLSEMHWELRYQHGRASDASAAPDRRRTASVAGDSGRRADRRIVRAPQLTQALTAVPQESSCQVHTMSLSSARVRADTWPLSERHSSARGSPSSRSRSRSAAPASSGGAFPRRPCSSTRTRSRSSRTRMSGASPYLTALRPSTCARCTRARTRSSVA